MCIRFKPGLELISNMIKFAVIADANNYMRAISAQPTTKVPTKKEQGSEVSADCRRKRTT